MKKIKLLVMDVDGTLTNGSIYMGDNGEVFKAFHVKDGYAITHFLEKNEIKPVIITGRKSEITARRCEELNIKLVYQGIQDKKAQLLLIANKYRIALDEIAYIGDDINDLECMNIVGVAGCPYDSCDEVKNIAHYITKKKGGEGAVREFIEWILKGERR